MSQRVCVNKLDLTHVMSQCVFNILESSSVILRCVFNMSHRTVVTSYDVLVRSTHVTRAFEGHFSKQLRFCSAREPWGTEGQPAHQERVLFQIEVITLYATRTLREISQK